MSKIHVLSEQLANQIAAGEVVERPASVVKELIENSLDAGADRIEVEIAGAGIKLIRVIDNGEGMDSDDIFLCLERHGTSKIRTQEDLGAICTLGFRGEALPSIGSVSQLSISSRPYNSELGYRVELRYGTLVKSHETGCAIGTIIEIKNLFGNVPARRKFLRTARTELGHIDEVIKNYSLVSPDVSFVLRVDGRETINLNSSFNLVRRLAKIMHQPEEFLPIDFAQDKEHKVSGLLVAPEKVTPGPARIRVFVNGRAVKDRMIIHAVAEGMRGFLMKGKNPAGLILLELPPEEIDVNVHPAKHEIRFRRSQEVHGLVQAAVSAAIRREQEQLQQNIFGERPRERSEIKRPSFSSTCPPVESRELEESEVRRESVVPMQAMSLTKTAEERKRYHRQEIPVAGHKRAEKIPLKQEPAKEQLFPRAGDDQRLEILGQVDDLYIFCRSQNGLVVIDQHAAHERLLYEKLKKHFTENSMVKQNLLFPETVELSLYQSQLVEKYLEDLERMGFSLRDFGGNAYVIGAIPALAGQIAPQKIFFDILEQFGSEGKSRKDAGDMLDSILANMACRAAIKAGAQLSLREMETLLVDMAAADLFSHCPHGRPVVKQFSSDEIKKWFYRT